MLNIIAIFDMFILKYSYLLPFRYWDLFGFPTKRLVKYCFRNMEGEKITGTVNCIAHSYAYDDTITKDNLTRIHQIYGTDTRERVRQILMKFIRNNYIQ